MTYSQKRGPRKKGEKIDQQRSDQQRLEQEYLKREAEGQTRERLEKEDEMVRESRELNLKLAFYSLQKQVQVLRLTEYAILISFAIGAAVLRAAMQFLPSVEPLSFFAVLSGWLFGKKKGFIAGASSLYISNFLVFGGQGPWTFFQALGFGIAGFLGGFLRKRSKKSEGFIMLQALLITFLATIIYEIIMNISSIPFYGMLGFVTAIPFTIIHIVSNLIFATALPKARNLVRDKAGLNRITICKRTLERLKRRLEDLEVTEKNSY